MFSKNYEFEKKKKIHYFLSLFDKTIHFINFIFITIYILFFFKKKK